MAIRKNLFLFFVLAMSLSMLLSSGKAAAQSYHNRNAYDRFSILFRINESRIDTLFMENRVSVRYMSDFIDRILSESRYRLDSVSIVASASQDGRLQYNIMLSEKRAGSAASFVNTILDGMSDQMLVKVPLGEDWDTFENMVEEDTQFPSREEALEIIRSDMDEDLKERRLRNLPGFFRYMLENHVHKLRVVHCIFHYTVMEPVIDTDLASLQTPVISSADEYYLPEIEYHGTLQAWEESVQRKMIFALRTNLLVPALNVGVEVPVGNKWSVGADYYFPWWLSRRNDKCIQMLSWFLDTKYWFGNNRKEKDKLSGHAVGFYSGFGYYDFQWHKSGYQGEFIDIGVDYTYSMPIAKNRLRLAFNIGAGWIHTVRRHYTPTDGYEELIKDPGVKHYKVNFFGPTRASVSLVVPITVKSKRGGAR